MSETSFGLLCGGKLILQDCLFIRPDIDFCANYDFAFIGSLSVAY